MGKLASSNKIRRRIASTDERIVSTLMALHDINQVQAWQVYTQNVPTSFFK